MSQWLYTDHIKKLLIAAGMQFSNASLADVFFHLHLCKISVAFKLISLHFAAFHSLHCAYCSLRYPHSLEALT